MILTDLITMFKRRTGRLDLTDVEITQYLNDACKVLDQLEASGKVLHRIFIDAAVDSYIYELPQTVRFVESATLHKSIGVTDLQFADPKDLTRVIRGQEWNSDLFIDTFTVVTAGLISDMAIADLPMFSDVVGLNLDTDMRNLYLIVFPKVTEASVIELEASVYSATLDSVNTANYWSITKPELVIESAQYLLVKDLINIDESTKILGDLRSSVLHISYDYYAQERINQMGG